MTNWTIPERERRLLVLNSCSGATAQYRDWIARIGLAQNLVRDAQAIVGHLWPAPWTTGIAFGAALAACLEIDEPNGAALAAIRLMSEPEHLGPFLDQAFEGCDDLLDRLNRSSEDLTRITSWGCPILLT